MTIIGLIILGCAIIAAIVVYITSNNGDPKERAKEAGLAAGAGAMYSAGCIIQTILSALPFIIGLFFIGLILKSCN
jgi:hypothetical protein